MIGFLLAQRRSLRTQSPNPPSISSPVYLRKITWSLEAFYDHGIETLGPFSDFLPPRNIPFTILYSGSPADNPLSAPGRLTYSVLSILY